MQTSCNFRNNSNRKHNYHTGKFLGMVDTIKQSSMGRVFVVAFLVASDANSDRESDLFYTENDINPEVYPNK